MPANSVTKEEFLDLWQEIRGELDQMVLKLTSHDLKPEQGFREMLRLLWKAHVLPIALGRPCVRRYVR